MKANYGYKDGSGEYFITIDTDRCNGCGDCAPVCPEGVLKVGEDPNDPLRDQPVAYVVEHHRKRLKYSCGPCKPVSPEKGYKPPCIRACKEDAITHSW